MKTSIFVMAAAAALLSFSSCDNRENIQGQWQSNQNMNLPNTVTSTAAMVMTFSQDGNVTVNSDINFAEPVAAPNDSLSPYQISVSATASIDGKWEYVQGENDEIMIKYNNDSFTLNLSPESIKYAPIMNSTDSIPEAIEQLKDAAVVNYSAMLSSYMRDYLMKFTKLEDIKVSNGTLSFEIDDFNGHDMDQHFNFTAIN